MDTISSMKVFVGVAKRSGFAVAARDLRLSPAAVTKRIAGLERHLGARLFDRTTRSVALTEPGRIYLERCLECLQAFEDANNSVHQFTQAPRGTLRVTAPVDLHYDLPGVVARFMNDHPGVAIELRLTNRPVDLVDEGIDVAVRVATSLTGDYIARKLAPVYVGLAGSRRYLGHHGYPKKPQDLRKHRNLVFNEPAPRLNWTFERNQRRVDVSLTPAMLSNSGTAILAAAAEGAGLAMAPSFNLRPFVDSGALELLLPDWNILPEMNLFAVYPHRRFVSPNVVLFVEALRQAFGDGRLDPHWPHQTRG